MAERRKVIKNKILAVGKMSRVFAVLRCVLFLDLEVRSLTETMYREESEAVSELKNISGSGALPSGALANGADGVKDAIKDFNDARKSDIENERLPPELIDASEVRCLCRLLRHF